MKAFISISLILGGLSLAWHWVVPTAYAQSISYWGGVNRSPIKLNIKFDCPQSFNTGVPVQKDIPVTIESDGSWSVPPELNQILQAVESRPQYDFYSCLTSVVYDLKDAVRRLPQWAKPSVQDKFNKTAFQVWDKVSDIGHASSDGQSLQIPGLTRGRSFTAEEEHSVRRLLAGESESMLYGFLISKEALDRMTPEVIKKLQHNKPHILEQWGENIQFAVGVLQREASAADEKSKARYQRAIRHLRSVLGRIPSRPGETQRTLYRLLCSTPHSLKQIKMIERHLNSQPICTQLATEAAGIVHTGRYGASYRQYQLRRKLDQKNGQPHYEMSLGIHFQTDPDVGPPSPAAQQQIEDMQNKTQECLAKYNKNLKTPQGAKLDIKVYYHNSTLTSEDGLVNKDDAANTAPIPFRDVSIESENFRSNATAWAQDASCGTILHELLHHAGLADEYHEHSRGPYDCRVEGPSDSIMSHHYKAFRYVDEGDVEQGFLCNCSHMRLDDERPVDDKERRQADKKRKAMIHNMIEELKERLQTLSPHSEAFEQTKQELREWQLREKDFKPLPTLTSEERHGILQRRKQCDTLKAQVLEMNSSGHSKQKQCPAGMERLGDEPYEIAPWRYWRKTSKRYSPNEALVVLKREADKDWLLHPAHFNVITQPGCPVNDLYYQCTAEAYTRTTTSEVSKSENHTRTTTQSDDTNNQNQCIKDVQPKCQDLWNEDGAPSL